MSIYILYVTLIKMNVRLYGSYALYVDSETTEPIDTKLCTFDIYSLNLAGTEV